MYLFPTNSLISCAYNLVLPESYTTLHPTLSFTWLTAFSLGTAAEGALFGKLGSVGNDVGFVYDFLLSTKPYTLVYSVNRLLRIEPGRGMIRRRFDYSLEEKL